MNHDREVDIIDLVQALFRRKAIVLLIPLVCVGAALIWSQITTKRYLLQTNIEIGKIFTSSGTYEYVESATVSKTRLEAYGKSILKENDDYSQAFSWDSLNFQVTAPQGSGILQVELNSPEQKIYQQYIQEVLERFTSQQNRIIDTERVDIQSTLDDLSSKQEELEKRQTSKKNMIESLRQESSYLKNEITSAKEQLQAMREMKNSLLGKSEQASPLELMYFSNEMLRLEELIINLNQELISTIPQQIEKLNEELESMAYDHQSTKHATEKFENRLRNLFPTQALNQTEFSTQPVWPPTLLFSGLAFFAGLIISIVIVLVLEFWRPLLRGTQQGEEAGDH
jgi:capsular polysaccharide biosynthesis protein